MTAPPRVATALRVTGLRHLLRSHARLAALVLAAALLLRVLVPAGFMPTWVDGRVTLTICPGTTPAMPAVARHGAAMPGMAHHEDKSTAQSPCAYADLALPALGSANPALLAAALAFVLALALHRAIPLPPRSADRLRPPLRAPPFPV